MECMFNTYLFYIISNPRSRSPLTNKKERPGAPFVQCNMFVPWAASLPLRVIKDATADHWAFKMLPPPSLPLPSRAAVACHDLPRTLMRHSRTRPHRRTCGHTCTHKRVCVYQTMNKHIQTLTYFLTPQSITHWPTYFLVHLGCHSHPRSHTHTQTNGKHRHHNRDKNR